MQLSNLKELFIRNKDKIILLTLCCIPLKLSWTYIVLLPSILLWILFCTDEVISSLKSTKQVSTPLGLFFLISIGTSIFGLEWSTSTIELLRAIFISICALFFFYHTDKKNIITFTYVLCASQALAAAHTITEGMLFIKIPRFFHGAVTESGQLALTIPLCFALFIILLEDIKSVNTKRYFTALSLINTLCLVVCGLHINLNLSSLLFGSVLTFFGITTSLSIIKLRKSYPALQIAFYSIILPFLAAALIINLKRGPWAGVLVAALFFTSVISFRYFIPIFSLATLSALFITPIRDRLLYSSQHFFISGGRGEIWRVGSELIERFPLGIGYHNSSFMHKFSLEIPKELEHFHSNLINILVETGWIGLFLYLGFIFSIAKVVKNHLKDPLVLAFGASLLSWQVAGLVEYNFGDSEVYILAMIVLGLLLSRLKPAKSQIEKLSEAK